MIITFDTETRGLFGEIFVMGYFDGRNFVRTTPQNFINELQNYGEKIYAYAHNLDFDLAKLWKANNGLDIDWNSSIIIHHSVVRARIKGTDIYLCDSYHLLPSSLEKLSTDFELETPKVDLNDYIKVQGYKDKEDFFARVPAWDPKLLEYLEGDCRALYELLMKVMAFSGLTEDEFVKCPTLPSLSMKMYQKECPEEYAKITENKLTKELEEFGRAAYMGARVEVIKPILNRRGYHYDVNSLYPFVMKSNSFPIGKYKKYTGRMAEFAYQAWKKGAFKHGLVKAKVYIPDMYIPPLPYREDKLYFPVGKFNGTWTVEELSLAESYGAQVYIEEGIFWEEGEYIFKRFIEKMEYEKTHSKGARRNFFKLIQNSLYGKFGMRRERETYMNIEDEAALMAKKKPYVKIKLFGDKELILTSRKTFADYIRPHIAAYVTSYARMYLYLFIMTYVDEVYYFDTDSLILDVPMKEEYIDEKEYGRWKLEREIEQAIFLQPKLYAEKTIDGKEVLKSKGLIKDYRKTIDFRRYEEILQAVLKGEKEIKLYDGYLGRRKFISALKEGKDVDEPVILRKKLNLGAGQKRIIDYKRNSSRAIKVNKW